MSDIKLLGGLLSIGQITSEVTASIAERQAEGHRHQGHGHRRHRWPACRSASPTRASWASGLAGRPCPGDRQPGRPPGRPGHRDQDHAVSQGRRRSHRGGPSGRRSQIEVPVAVQGYPGVLDVTFGRALAELEVSALSDRATLVRSTTRHPSTLGLVPAPGPRRQHSRLRARPARPRPPVSTPGGRRHGTELVSVPVGRIVEDWDLTTLYRVLLLGGIALFAAGQVIVRSTLRPDPATQRPTTALEVVMASDDTNNGTSRRALIEVSPDLAARFGDPRLPLGPRGRHLWRGGAADRLLRGERHPRPGQAAAVPDQRRGGRPVPARRGRRPAVLRRPRRHPGRHRPAPRRGGRAERADRRPAGVARPGTGRHPTRANGGASGPPPRRRA